MRSLIEKFIQGYLVWIGIVLLTFTSAFIFHACTNESYYEEDKSTDRAEELYNFKKSMQIAGEEFKNNTTTNKNSNQLSREALAEEFVQSISSDALILIKSYGVTEQDLINQFGSLDSNKIVLTAQVIVAEEELIDEGKTLSIFVQEDYQLSSMSFFGINSTYAVGGGTTVGGCLLEAIGVRTIVQALIGDFAALGTAGVLKIVGQVATKYAGVIGGGNHGISIFRLYGMA